MISEKNRKNLINLSKFFLPFLIGFGVLFSVGVFIVENLKIGFWSLISAYFFPPLGKETIIPSGILLGIDPLVMALSIAYLKNRYTLPAYRASATLLLEEEEGRSDLLGEIKSVSRTRRKTDLANELSKLKAFSLHRRTIDSLKWDIFWVWSVEYIYFITLALLSMGYLKFFNWQKKTI